MALLDDGVKGAKNALEIAEKGMALFAAQGEDEIALDVDGATQFKAEADAKYAALEAEAAALTGKDNKKARSEKNKEASAVQKTPEYIDACRVIKGQPPKNGHFGSVKKAASAVSTAASTPELEAKEAPKDAPPKEEKGKPKKVESAGISKAERDELEKLKNDIIARKKQLKETGMSGGQINKDEQVAAWVSRMNELKEKECPGALAAAKDDKKKKKVLSSEEQAMKEDLTREIEEYRNKLKTEFGYTNKDIKADPDLADIQKRLDAMK